MRITRKLGLLVGVVAVAAAVVRLAHQHRPGQVAAQPVRGDRTLARRVTWTEVERARLRLDLAAITLNPARPGRPLASPPNCSPVPESRWFRAGPEPPDANDCWQTAADAGWRAAQRAAHPRPAGATHSGLPRRRPGAQLVPGAMPALAGAPAVAAATDRRDPAEVGAVAAAYSRGIASGLARHTTFDGAHASVSRGNPTTSQGNGARTS